MAKRVHIRCIRNGHCGGFDCIHHFYGSLRCLKLDGKVASELLHALAPGALLLLLLADLPAHSVQDVDEDLPVCAAVHSLRLHSVAKLEPETAVSEVATSVLGNCSGCGGESGEDTEEVHVVVVDVVVEGWRVKVCL